MPFCRPRSRGDMRQPRLFLRGRRDAEAHGRRARGHHGPVAPQVESGDVSGWIGVGRVGVNGKRGVLRVGLLGQADGTMQLYYEVRRNGNWIRHLGPVVQPGERHFVKVVRSRKNAKRWRVLIDGNTVGPSMKLGKGWKWLRAVATAESWDGGAPSCNQFQYAFGKVNVKSGRGWRRADTKKLIQDPGYKVLKQHKSHFFATNVPPAPVGDARAFSGDWETADASQWSGNHWNRSVPLSDQFKIVTDPVRQGGFAAKFTVRPGDKFGTTSGERSEVFYTGADEHRGDDLWYAWSTLFPSDWSTPTGWSIFTQWHSYYPVSPPISFNMKGERIQVNLNTGSVDSGAASFKPVYPITDALKRGVWNDFVVHIVWSGTNGSLEVWHRTGSNPFEKKVDAVGIPTMQVQAGVSVRQLPEDRLLPERRLDPRERPLPGRLQPCDVRAGSRAGLRRRPGLRGAASTSSRPPAPS